MQTVTFYETGFGLFLIPYQMKHQYRQTPRDIGEEFRDKWIRVQYDLLNLNLHAGEWDEAQIDVEEYLEKCAMKELEYRCEELKRQIAETKRGIDNIFSSFGKVVE